MKFQEIALRLSHLLCSPITGNTRYLSRSSVMYDHYQEMFEKMLKECRVFGLKKKEKGEQAEKTPSRMKISLETVEIKHSLCPLKTGQEKKSHSFSEKTI